MWSKLNKTGRERFSPAASSPRRRQSPPVEQTALSIKHRVIQRPRTYHGHNTRSSAPDSPTGADQQPMNIEEPEPVQITQKRLVLADNKASPQGLSGGSVPLTAPHRARAKKSVQIPTGVPMPPPQSPSRHKVS